MCQRPTASSLFPVSGLSWYFGLPWRVSSIPSTRTGASAAGRTVAASSRAAAELADRDEAKLSDLVNGKGGSNVVDLTLCWGSAGRWPLSVITC
ncbi:hypothetical protein GCM10010178_29760 [Lentzea flava]|uniref:Uncharacterized protein n=1 Tax=Lentzea flava TaxID=103732 RepID=A0ABQ2UJ69_9PSEU|nr:hypothetical protein GCM10010178_29760 [Lentzea flava]